MPVGWDQQIVVNALSFRTSHVLGVVQTGQAARLA